MKKVFTHKGRLIGDARSGGRTPVVVLRLTPSGSHWVDLFGRKFSAQGGHQPGKWPMWVLDLDTVTPLEQEVTI